jgi:DNA-binding transcriptional regulator YhcF (GntR family)
MIGRGQAERVTGGLVAIAALQAEGPFADAFVNTHAVILESLGALKHLGYDLAASAAPSQVDEPPPPGLVVRIVFDMNNRYAELLSPTFGGILPTTIWAGVMRANVRNLMADPEMAWRYAEQGMPPPDHLRRPISVRALATELMLPFETTRRHVATMIDKGWLVTVQGQGVIAPAAVLGADALGRTNLQLPGLYARMIGDLTRAGFDLDAL